ncbi:MAG TPA: alkaline phosphatase family protein [Aliidongia sp.]|nr:alkaline phosphatase family protein [Aliidongia sp.]
MLNTIHNKRRVGAVLGASLVALIGAGYASAGAKATNPDAADKIKTTSPIKHVIVIVGENRGFDHTFATYQPKRGQKVNNLLSEGIINADGTPGPNFSKAQQFSVPTQNQIYFISADKNQKVPYTALPGPDTNGAPQAQSTSNAPFTTAAIANVEPDLEQDDKVLLTTGFTGLPKGPDARISGRPQYAAGIPNGPYQISGLNASAASLAAGADQDITDDDYTGDTTHRFYTNWQQSDCSADAQHVSKTNPSGCLQDLFPFIMTTYKGGADEGVGNSMAFYNNQDEDAEFFTDLANNFAMADNMHQSVWGGTAVQHVALLTGDAIWWSDGNGNPTVPTPASLIANPNPVLSGQKTVNQYTVDGNFSKCADFFQPGIGPIITYLNSQHLTSNCETDHYYMLNNTNPGYLPNGALSGAGNVPPSSTRTIGDALNDKSISWAYYGGAYAAAVRLSNIAVQLNPTAPNLSAAAAQDPADAIGLTHCDICEAFEYSKSIMSDDTIRTTHLKDVSDLDAAIADSTLPAVSFVKPDTFLDGHPASSKVSLFEGFTRKILDALDANPKLKAETAVIITFDEAGGYWDSGYVQPIDFFGDSNRIPMIIISPFSTGGTVTHTYYDHVSILKFIERNWKLQPLTARSRDNLPNPTQKADNPYVPTNSPALGDLFDLFDFTTTPTATVNFNPRRTATADRI